MTVEFRGEADPSGETRTLLESLHPENPFSTVAYSRAVEDCGLRAFSFLLYEKDEARDGCYGFLRAGRFSSVLEIHSAPVASEIAFWSGVTKICRQHKVTDLEVLSFASPSVAIPHLEGEERRKQRVEYLVDLPDRDLIMSISTHHRRHVRKADKAGVTITRGPGLDAVGTHCALMLASLARRKERGEDVSEQVDERLYTALVRRGAGELFQATLNGEVLSSNLILKARRAAYYNTAGTTPEGMRSGASQLLIYSITRLLQSEGLLHLNLGGADPGSGLAEFKQGFGARAVNLETAFCFIGNRLQRTLMTATRKLRSA